MQELFEHAASDAGAYHRFVDFMSAHTERDSRRAGLRVALVALTAVAAMVLPNLEQMMSLLGAVTGSLLAVIFPVIIDIRCRLRHDWPSELRDGSTPGAPGVGYSKTAALVVDLVILAAGVTSGLAGAVSVAPVAEY